MYFIPNGVHSSFSLLTCGGQVRMLKDFDRKKIQVRRVEGMSKYPPQYAVE